MNTTDKRVLELRIEDLESELQLDVEYLNYADGKAFSQAKRMINGKRHELKELKAELTHKNAMERH